MAGTEMNRVNSRKNDSNSQLDLKSVELFLGAGGLGIGVSQAGFKPEIVVENDRNCCNTIRKNQKHGLNLVAKWPLQEEDVRDVDFSSLSGQIDLVTGGPPCQPFSIGGKHYAEADGRDMFPEAVRVVRELKPKVFLFENVKGLTRNSFSNYFRYIQLQMTYPQIIPRTGEIWKEHLKRLEHYKQYGRHDDLYYEVHVQVLNSADYGVPQRRERVFFVGIRSDVNIDWSFPSPTHSYDSLLLEQANGVYWERHEITKKERVLSLKTQKQIEKLKTQPYLPFLQPWQTVRDALADLPDPEYHPNASAQFLNHKFQPGARIYKGHTGSPYDEPAKALKAGVNGVPGGENMLIRPNGSVRYFSIRESARLQTFPDEFRFVGSWSTTMRQLGNAVPVQLSEILANRLYKKLSECTKSRENSLSVLASW